MTKIHRTLGGALAVILSCAQAASAADIVDTAASARQFSTLIAAAKAADLADTLATSKGITVFAPTDAAFAKLPKATVASLLKPENREQLREILLYHVLDGVTPAAKVPTKATAIATLEGRAVRVRRHGKSVRVNNARVVAADVAADNGVIHAIDTVLTPSRK